MVGPILAGDTGLSVQATFTGDRGSEWSVRAPLIHLLHGQMRKRCLYVQWM